jgi:hypothetical protein
MPRPPHHGKLANRAARQWHNRAFLATRFHMVTLITVFGAAMWAVALALGRRMVLDRLERRNQGVRAAAMLAGELEVYLNSLRSDDALDSLRAMARLGREDRIAVLRRISPMPISHPLYDMILADIGRLAPRDASDISRIYNAAAGFRLFITSMTMPAFVNASDTFQADKLNEFIAFMNDEVPAVRGLIARLRVAPQQQAFEAASPGWWRMAVR